ncbi:DUF2971 domain-containing protein [Rhodococcus sp. NPDC055024]
MTPETDTDRILYHYTTAPGLLGILAPIPNGPGLEHVNTSALGSFSLWATDAGFLNDTGELQYGRAQLRRELRAHVPPGSSLDGAVTRLDAILDGTLGDPYEVSPGDRDTDRRSVYATCFCERGDLLSQWRGYGDGLGYSIGFRKSALDSMNLVAGPDDGTRPPLLLGVASTVKVSYGESVDVLNAAAAEILSGAFDERIALQRCLVALATVKSAAFESEHEWRLFSLEMEKYSRCAYRVGPLGVTPYVNLLYFPREEIPNPIARVWVSPGPNMALRIRVARQILNQRGFRDVEVLPSQISYRG